MNALSLCYEIIENLCITSEQANLSARKITDEGPAE